MSLMGNNPLWGPAHVLVLILLAYVIGSDTAKRRIPNWSVSALAIGWVAFFTLSVISGFQWPQRQGLTALTFDFAVDPLIDLGIAIGALSVGFLFYLFRWLGAGDAKIIAAVALWSGRDDVLAFLIVTALAGGILALVFMVPMVRSFLSWMDARLTTIGSVETRLGHDGLPYGVAIALGGVAVFLPRISGIFS